jgi:hypothetical protein
MFQTHDESVNSSKSEGLKGPAVTSGLLSEDGRPVHPSTTEQRLSRYRYWTEDWWLLEIVSAIIGVLALLAICLILWKYDYKSLPELGSVFGSSITLNSILAILRATTKAALMLPVIECISQLKWSWFRDVSQPLSEFLKFDNASRGWWGGLLLIWRLRGM